MTDQKINLRNRIPWLLALLLASQFLFGCAESMFDLSIESRLPKWFKLPPGLTRADVKVKMSYYVLPWGRIAVFNFSDNKGNQIAHVSGKLKGYEPKLLKKSKRTGMYDGDPSYEIITVNGITDIIEHRKMEPIFYVTDDPEVWAELGASQEQKK